VLGPQYPAVIKLNGHNGTGPVPPPDYRPFQAVPKIYLCSRTHSQLHQLVRELKRTPYRPKYTILGSRKQYCPIKKTDDECNELTKDKLQKPTETKCGFYNKKASLMGELERAKVWDMEDLGNAVAETQGCSFFTMKDLHKSAELILCPYNYIFDTNIRNALEIKLHNAAVVIDEGHNIEDVCREGASMEVSAEDVAAAAAELKEVKGYFHDAGPAQLLLEKLSTWLAAALDPASASGQHGRHAFGARSQHGPVRGGPGDTIWKGEEAAAAMYAALGPSAECVYNMRRTKMGATDQECVKKHVAEVIQQATSASAFDGELMRNINQSTGKFGKQSLDVANKVCEGLAAMLKNARDYAMCACTDLENPGSDGRGGSSRPKPGWALWCLRPAVAFRPVANEALCVILTSGTLSPTDSLEGELGVAFPIKVEAPHIIPRGQLHVEASAALGDFTRAVQDSDKMPHQLGTLLLRYAPMVPGGMLVFLPRYSLISRVMDEWGRSGMLRQLEAHKTVVVEEPGAQTLQGTMDEFKASIESGKGGLFLAVYRGKVSEGLDFKDDNARAVFCVGIPFPSLGDVKVKLKREYNSHPDSRTSGMLSGGEWYQHQAFRAYNQALGRCIRHQHDYACIFLVDARFCMHNEAAHNRSMVSKWMRNFVQYFTHPQESRGTVKEFFERHRENPPAPPLRPATFSSAARAAPPAALMEVSAAGVGVGARGGGKGPVAMQLEAAADDTLVHVGNFAAADATTAGGGSVVAAVAGDVSAETRLFQGAAAAVAAQAEAEAEAAAEIIHSGSATDSLICLE